MRRPLDIEEHSFVPSLEILQLLRDATVVALADRLNSKNDEIALIPFLPRDGEVNLELICYFHMS